MILIISVIAIVAVFSIYDYYQSRSWQAITSKQRNDAVFENRNKLYGAYEIRRNYDKRLVAIMLFMFVGFGALWGATSLFNKEIQTEKPRVVQIDPTADPFDQKEEEKVEEEVVEEEKPAVETPPEQTLEQQTEFRVPEISDTVHSEITYVSGETGNTGSTTITGSGSGFGNPIGPTGNGGDGVLPSKPEIIDIPDLDPEFPGGLNAMRRYIADNIDINSIEGSAKVYLKFVVDEKGDITRVSVTKTSKECPSCEAAAIKVVKGMPKWRPAIHQGENVKSYFRLPITILDN
jgi:protein TonB